MFDRLDILTRDDSRSPTPIPTRSRSDRDREQPRMGHRREHEPRQDKRGFQERVEGALADVGMYHNVSYRDLVESQFGGHPYTARRAVDRMIRDGHVREHQAKGPRGGTYKVLTLTEAGARKARDYAVEQGFDKEQQTWSGLVKRGELSHDTAVYRRRKALIEPVFGVLKEQRGMRRFRRRGLAKVAVEMLLAATAYNLTRLYHARPSFVTPPG